MEDGTIRVTSTARRDIADAKNMLMTIPANVLYLGPINSRAESKMSENGTVGERCRARSHDITYLV